jgi:hypothetical protein
MTRLQGLRANILAIPDKRMRSDFVGTLRQYCEKVQKSRAMLENAVHGQKQAVYVFHDADVSESNTKASKAISAAKNLAEKIGKDFTLVQGKGTDKSVVTISDLAEASLNELKSQWRKLVLGRTRTFQTLVQAAKEANLEGSEMLRILLSSIEGKATIPPTTFEQAEEIKRQLDDLSKSISDIGLEGEVGAFLISAAKGTADPQALYKPAVKEFIERHDLWRLLRVSLT